MFSPGYLLRARKVLIRCVALVACTAALLQEAHGQEVVLTDHNATAKVDVGSPRGLFQFGAASGNLVKQRWFWFRIGTNGPEASIDTISAPVVQQPNSGTLYVTYNNGQFGVEVAYQLTGGDGLDLSESLLITNATSSPIEFHLFK